jgi:hypothetical protein
VLVETGAGITVGEEREEWPAGVSGLRLVRCAGAAALRGHLDLQRVIERGAGVGFRGAYLVSG